MSRSAKILIVAGLLLAVWGMAYGLIYAAFIEHQTLGAIGANLNTAFVQGAQKNTTGSQGALAQYSAAMYVYVRQVDAHGHWIGLAMLLIVLGIAFDRLQLSEPARAMIAVALAAGAALFPLGVLMEIMSRGAGPKAMAVAGSALVIAALVAIAFGLARSRPSV